MCFIESAVGVSSIQLQYCTLTINASNKKKNNLLSSRIIRFRPLHYIIFISIHHRVSIAHSSDIVPSRCMYRKCTIISISSCYVPPSIGALQINICRSLFLSTPEQLQPKRSFQNCSNVKIASI